MTVLLQQGDSALLIGGIVLKVQKNCILTVTTKIRLGQTLMVKNYHHQEPINGLLPSFDTFLALYAPLTFDSNISPLLPVG